MLFALFTFGALVFKVRIAGSFPGFIGVCVASALMSSCFGLLIAAIGKTPEATLYAANHYLGRHIDSHVAEGWRVAYVLNLAIDETYPMT